jgi:hypothetical protein
MIILFLKRLREVISIKIEGTKIGFSQLQGRNVIYSDISGLKLSIAGIIRQFPDLADKDAKEIRKEGVKRFKEHLISLGSEEKIAKYLIDDLKKWGYELVKVKNV